MSRIADDGAPPVFFYEFSFGGGGQAYHGARSGQRPRGEELSPRTMGWWMHDIAFSRVGPAMSILSLERIPKHKGQNGAATQNPAPNVDGCLSFLTVVASAELGAR
jgi:hypothetical protein